MKFLLALCSLWCSVASAQNVLNIEHVQSQASVMMGQGEYKGCGLRFLGIDLEPLARSMPTVVWDVSLTLLPKTESLGLFVALKTGALQVEKAQLVDITGATQLKVNETWIQPEGLKAWKPERTNIPGENGKTSMTVYPVDGVIPSLLEIFEKAGSTKFLLGVRLEGEHGYRVYRFGPTINQADSEAFVSCVGALVDQVYEAVKRKSKGK